MIVSYNWLKEYFVDDLPAPTEVAAALTKYAFEVESLTEKDGDTILDIDVLPNRAHDCLSHDGIARELSASLNLPLKKIELTESVEDDTLPTLTVKTTDEACRLYLGRRTNQVTVKSSPAWLKNRLAVLGQRSINTVIDAANLTMLATGQPLHVFDADKVSGAITVRRAKRGEVVVTLDGDEIELPNETLVIADDDDILAIAGIKGGRKAAVSLETKNLILESANFAPVVIRRTSQKINLRTDASKRFENDLPLSSARLGLDRLTALIISLTEDKGDADRPMAGPVVEFSRESETINKIDISANLVSDYLGLPLNEDDISDILHRLDFAFSLTDGIFTVWPPAERLDLLLPADLVEEIGRLHGYENIPSVLPTRTEPADDDLMFLAAMKVRAVLLAENFSEHYGYAFTKKGELKVKNPLAKNRPALRLNLTDELTEKTKRNTEHLLFDSEAVFLFEIGTIWPAGREEMSVGLSVAYRRPKQNNSREIIEKALRVLEKAFNLKDKLSVSELADDLSTTVAFPLTALVTSGDDSPADLGPYLKPNARFTPIINYPRIIRDVAIFVPAEIVPDKVAAAILEPAGPLLVHGPVLFDDFTKDGRRSLAWRLVFQSTERTLADEEVNDIMTKVTNHLEKNNGWQVR
ncbi:MAG: phenylalanine--tRNA ligase subunit beta [Candidatus Paceibacterota bacterium]